jgi:hypothetical protein
MGICAGGRVLLDIGVGVFTPEFATGLKFSSDAFLS